nr:reverse transcriptase domain-containing protein [uncultured Campylobacter sp.]
MFMKTLEQIFTKNALSFAFDEISASSSGLDDISYADFKKNFDENTNHIIRSLTNGTYAPEPLRKINIPKENRSGVRPIGISSIKDKLVQRVLYSELSPYFDETFLSNSYAYRPHKSTYKAINRASNFINEGDCWILKADVKDFFESIDHSKLLQILQKHIKDAKIISPISLFLKTGGFLKHDFKEHKNRRQSGRYTISHAVKYLP